MQYKISLLIYLSYYIDSTTNFIAVFSSPSIIMSLNAGITTKFCPEGAKNPLAIQIDFIAWFKLPAPIVWISTHPSSLNTLAIAPATLEGFDFDDTFKISIISRS